jgi:hypothetical protein
VNPEVVAMPYEIKAEYELGAVRFEGRR